jgi:F420-dependent oxidoreductase-like protein
MDLEGVPVERQWEAMLGAARRMESEGYESLWVFDHFHTVPEPTQEATFEAWTTMAAMAAATTTIRLGQMCTCNSYRNPSYMAKVASCVDVMSGGRLEFAIGAGWYEHEYLAYGYEFPKPSVRIGMLGEAVQIIKAMWADDEAHFEGEYYRVAGAINRPKPLQQPHPPLWIAGSGPQLTLRLVAEHGDRSNFGGGVDAFAKKSQILEQHCEAVGRDFGEIERTTVLNVVVDPDRGALERAARQMGDAPDDFVDDPMTAAGSIEEIADRVGRYAEAGCSYLIAYFPDAAWGGSIEAFAREVIPRVR